MNTQSKDVVTPRPWVAKQQFKNVWQLFSGEICVANCQTTFRGVGVGNQDAITEANAALIVAAVNAFDPRRDELVKGLVDAASNMLPRCGFIVDRDKGTQCGEAAPWVGSFGFRYCDAHQAMRVQMGRSGAEIDEETAALITALATYEAVKQ